MTLTPKQRLEAYEWARAEVYSEQYFFSVCGRLNEWLLGRAPFELNMFPEFLKQRPTGGRIGEYWWPFNHSGHLQRLAALDRAIELVKEKIK